MGASAVGVVAGGILGADAHSKYSALAAQCPTHTNCGFSASALTSYHTASGAFVGSLVGVGALLGTGIVLFVMAPSGKTSRGAFLAPRVGAGYVGVEGGF
jgi:hypothetical protein